MLGELPGMDLLFPEISRMSKTRVYVSSTFEDLKDYRAKVNEGLRRAGYELVVMEDYPAFDRRPLAKCLADVASCDLYVGILAKRYGYIPAQGNPENLSITEREYLQATVSCLPRLVFQLDSKAPWLEQFDDRLQEDGDRGVSIRRFRDHVGKEHGNRFFSSPDELARLVLEAASAWEKERLAGPAGKQPTSPLSESAFRWPAAWDFSAYMIDKRRGFARREWLFAHIQTWLADPDSRALLIRADYGVGKSAFFAELVARNPDGAILAWHFCQHDTRETLRAGTFVRSLAAQLQDRLPGYREQVEAQPELQERLEKAMEDPGSAFEAAILNPLAALPAPPKPRLILIDALDEALEVDAEDARRAGTLVTLLANKARRLPPWVQVAVTSRNNPEVVGRLQQAFTLAQIDAEGQHNREDLYAFALNRACAEPIAGQLAAAGKSAEWLATLLRDKAGGKFLYVARALRDLEGGRLTLAQAGALPPGMDGFYRDAFERRFDRAGRDYEPYRKLLGLLCALREPVSAEPLAELLGCQPAHVKDARALLPDFIVQRRRGYTFEHFSISEWLSRENEEGFPRAGPFAVDLAEAEAGIHQRVLQRIAEGSIHRFDYLVRHLAAHLPDATERQNAFTMLMQDFCWLRERLRLVGADALIGDCRHLAEDGFGSLLAACLRNSAHVLRRDPGQLAAQVLGRLNGRALIPGISALCTSVRKKVAGSPATVLLPSTASLRLETALLGVLEGHGGDVSALAILPDGRLASGSIDHTIRLWDLSKGIESQVLEGHGGWVKALAVLPDGRLVSGSRDATIRLWDLAGGSPPRVLEGNGGGVTALAVLPDGKLAAGCYDRTIRLWDLQGGGAPQVVENQGAWVGALAALPDGRLASGSGNGTICLWPARGVAEPQVLRGAGCEVNTLSVLPDGRLVSGSFDGKIRVWDLRGETEPEVLEGHWLGVCTLLVLPDGRLASGGVDGTVRLWGLQGSNAPQVQGGHDVRVNALAVLPSGRLASGSDDGTIRLWGLQGSGAPLVQRSHSDQVNALAVLPNGRVASASHDCTICLWDLEGRADLQVTVGEGGPVFSLAVLPDGRLASGSFDGTVRLWPPLSFAEPQVLDCHGAAVNALAVLPDGRLVAQCDDGTIRLLDLQGGAEPQVLEGPGFQMKALAVLPDGRVASASNDGTILLWPPRSEADPELLAAYGGRVNVLTVLPDGRLVSGHSDSTIRLWDLRGKVRFQVLENPAGSPVTALAVLPDGRLVAATGHRVLVWQRQFERITAGFEADADVYCLLALPVGQIVAGDASGRLHFLDLTEPRT
ncbi:DUF4062 domain-containing protein [Thauera sp. 2A1]|uniref:DUF4062 domain-containing protein n=1 Tax=Thauera sp. 2A1 TaxID=2570191 RepID=UPI0012915370|nr:DUF4062 domain-containing protein [Thauera sp. 2A1]KAI5912223.1 DUF4062 domain-containing protein [Thauera sp. 2A1]KAI5915048.1 DUF4062 domain-containing protein [Thauera sp. 2A1]